jgi:hypothetical protein
MRSENALDRTDHYLQMIALPEIECKIHSQHPKQVPAEHVPIASAAICGRVPDRQEACVASRSG